jgi:DegV family protein with EDD domain
LGAIPAKSKIMPNVCILTDSTAQFTQSIFPGQERVHVIPFGIQDTADQEGKSLPGGFIAHKRLIPPSPKEFLQFYASLSHVYDSILVLTLSSQLFPVMNHARSASDQFCNGITVEVVDSQTTAIGLGMLVQLAAGALSQGASLREIEQRLRANIPRIYMLFFIPELTYLAHAGLMDHAQALVAEMMGILPIFTFEEGRLVPMEKVRTPRHVYEAFQNFVAEFATPSHIALAGSLARGRLRTSPLRQFVKDTFPGTLFSEHPVQPLLATLLGPHSLGLAVMEIME